MEPLSKLVNFYYCPQGREEVPADWALFGKFFNEAYTPSDVKTLKEWMSHRESMLKVLGLSPRRSEKVVKVFGVSFVNDLFLGATDTDEDGIQRVGFPGLGVQVTTASLSEDWRYLILAVASGVQTDKPAILEVYYPGAVVRGFVDEKTWEAVDELCSSAFQSQVFTPGPLCPRCVKRDTCTPFKTHEYRHDLPGPEVKDKKQRAHRLWLLAVGLRAKIKGDEALWKTVSSSLKACIEEGRININDYFYLDAKGGERTSYPFEAVHDLLKANGLWRSQYGRVNVTELHKDLPTFPQKVKDGLARLKVTDTVEPSLREVVSNGSHSIRSSVFRCLSQGKQG